MELQISENIKLAHLILQGHSHSCLRFQCIRIKEFSYERMFKKVGFMFWLGYIANEINKLRQRRYKGKESSVI